jgi:hypothetical protein
MPVQAEPVPNNTSWTGASGSGGIGSWGVAGNWLTDVTSQEVPTATLDAVLPGGPTNQTINLGSGAQAKSLFAQASGYTLQNGDLTFADRALHHTVDELRDLRAVERAAIAFLANCLLG